MGLIGDWRFYNGSTNDYSGNGYDGSIVAGNPIYYNNGLDFNGVVDKVFVNQSLAFNEITIAYWLRTPSSFSTSSGWTELGGNYNTFGIYGSVAGDTHSLRLHIKITGTGEVDMVYTPDPQLDVNKWYHVAGTYNDSQYKLYLNTSLVVNESHGRFDNTMTGICFYYNTFGGFSNGRCGECVIYDNALTADQITRIYDDTRSRYVYEVPGVTKGWSGRIILNDSLALEDLGLGSDTIPFTKMLYGYPITKTRNSSEYIDNSSFVLLYQNNSLISNVSYTTNASLGTLSINVSSANSSISASYSYFRVVGYATGITLSQVNNNENIFVIGSRVPQEIYEGNIEIEGSIDEFHIDRRASQLAIHDNISQKLSESTILQLRAAPNSPELFVRGCKFDSYDFNMAQDEFIVHGISFTAQNISTI